MVFPSVFGALRSLTTPIVQPLFLTLIYWIIQNIGVVLDFWANTDRIHDEKLWNANPGTPKVYDFIIAGAGSAGCLLANRLSRHYNVLLLEAGGEPNGLQFIPGFSMIIINRRNVDWMHRSVPQKHGSLISVNQQSSWSTGLGLGGSGNLNLMIHLRGHAKDYDNWAKVTGDPSWSWEGVREFFKRYEDYEIPGDPLNHGYGGDLRVEAPAYIGLARELVQSAWELGYPNVDLNAPFKEGFDVLRYPTKRGLRIAPFKAFLQPVRSRPSLTVVKFALVHKVLFRNGNVAYGVQYHKHGRPYVAHASKEVVISSGSVGTPRILMLSGVGPKEHLQEMNIPVVSNIPVGQNLQDHLAPYLGPFFVKEGTGTFLDRDLTPTEFLKWTTLGRGILTSTGCEAVGLISSELAKARGEGDWPDLTLFSYAYSSFRLGPKLVAEAFNVKEDEVNEYMKDDVGKDSIYITVQGSRPLSRGYIKLGGNSPYDRPIIEPNYLGDPEGIDLKVLLDGVKKTMTLMENTTTMGRILQTRFTTAILPGCEQHPFRSDAYWICFIRRFSVTLHHPVGTSSMGKVVDTQLRVLGLRNLRVVDASIQPVIITTNTQASTLMIAEKAADMILKYWSTESPTAVNFGGPLVGGLQGNGQLGFNFLGNIFGLNRQPWFKRDLQSVSKNSSFPQQDTPVPLVKDRPTNGKEEVNETFGIKNKLENFPSPNSSPKLNPTSQVPFPRIMKRSSQSQSINFGNAGFNVFDWFKSLSNFRL